ncbi:uncharacterized protein LOC131078550 isoform X1 [Cryptomeria japonica]|uniref:uncharacterized protein LOC131078550 isoform X1 n=1 Tax=Cryptomeria japonica TaxID=3369 RepID=UPI0027DA3313|nr:uncharacterized protein LOC131078550 isoform X1 [Cryptomeria japonica]
MPEGELTNHLWTSFKLEETSSEEKQRGKGEEKREGIGDEKHGSFWEQISSVTKEVKVSPVSKESKEIMEVSSGIGGRTQQRRQKKRCFHIGIVVQPKQKLYEVCMKSIKKPKQEKKEKHTQPPLEPPYVPPLGQRGKFGLHMIILLTFFMG